MLLGLEPARVRESDRVEVNLANAGWQLPFNPSQLVGEGIQQLASSWRNRRDGQLGQRANELRKRLAVGAGSVPRLPVKPEDGVPTATSGEVAGEHEEPVRKLL